jgi:hypothetical protein
MPVLSLVIAGGDINNPSDLLAFLPLSSILPNPNDRTLTVDGGAPWSHTPPPKQNTAVPTGVWLELLINPVR